MKTCLLFRFLFQVDQWRDTITITIIIITITDITTVERVTMVLGRKY
jgi:hypothetical protein